MRNRINIIEEDRLLLQNTLDAAKSQAQRNRLGQFATPTALARDILSYASTIHPAGGAIRFLDPAVGTGAFYSALRAVFPKKQITEALGFEIDPHYGKPAAQLWHGSDITLKLSDFTREEPSPRFNLIICNPPYVRHHHLKGDEKSRLQARALSTGGINLSGLAGLYCHFLGLAHGWMERDAVAGWLVPSEFMDVNYGQAVKRYLLDRVTLLHIHRFEPNDVQFADALVSSTVVWFRNSPPPLDHAVRFTLGGTLLEPKVSRTVATRALARESKWSRFPTSDTRAQGSGPTLADFFAIKRGLATGDNGFFILADDAIAARGLPREAFQPILPSPRYLTEDEVRGDSDGIPLIARRLFLLNTRLSEGEIKARYPALDSYLDEARTRGLHTQYLCSRRSPWYVQEKRLPAPIVCTYMGRGDSKNGRPFRFILNESQATAANVYLMMYPTPTLARFLGQDPSLLRRIWQVLNELAPDQLLSEGRVYGGGLYKLEPKELANVDASRIAALLPTWAKPAADEQLAIFATHMGDESHVGVA